MTESPDNGADGDVSPMPGGESEEEDMGGSSGGEQSEEIGKAKSSQETANDDDADMGDTTGDERDAETSPMPDSVTEENRDRTNEAKEEEESEKYIKVTKVG